ncbi:MAG TPA: hypothetical protein VLD17_15995 [Gemmatimonadaceae bacterium]|nr:hypothetical protein [Gemmatimonadaceae bacterium]
MERDRSGRTLYSLRMATSGSTRDPRRAGTMTRGSPGVRFRYRVCDI